MTFCLNSERNNCIMYDHDGALRLEKMKPDRSKQFRCKTSRFLLYSKHIGLPGKRMNAIQSFSFQLSETTIDYLFKVR